MESQSLQMIFHVLLACILTVTLPEVKGQCTPSHVSDPTNIVVPNDRGMQAILPNYQFLCQGLVTNIQMQVIGPETRFDIQIWRPILGESGSYTIHWSTPRTLITSQYFRNGNTLVYRDQIGVPVLPGDVLGFFIEPNGDPIRLPYTTNSSSPQSTLYYVDIDRPLCNMSLCYPGNDVKNLSRVFVSAEFEMSGVDDFAMIKRAQQFLDGSRILQGCSTSSFSECKIQPTALTPLMPRTATRTATTILPTPPPTNILPQPDFPRTEVSPSGTAGADGESSLSVPVSTSSIIFIVIGGVLFITLIVLVFVLIACVCSKKKSNQSSSSKRTPRETESLTESRSTVSTQLAVSSSVEHSTSSAGVSNPFRYVTAGHVYANAEVTRDGVFNSFAPLYQNETQAKGHDSINENGGDSVSTRRPRVWSTGALQTRPKINDRYQRAHSVSTRICHDVGSPPACESKVSIIGGGSPKRYSIEVSDDYSVPKPTAVISGRNILGDAEHDYSDPDEASLGYDRLVKNKKSRYDRLAPRPYEEAQFWEDALHQLSPPPLPPPHIRHLSPPPLPPKAEGKMTQVPVARQSVPDIISDEESDVNCLYTFVPTEEQRRLLKLQDGGHYEIAEDIDSNFTMGYDHLNFFKESDTYWAPATTASRLYEQLYENKYREIPRSQIRLMKRIGSGHFGTVSKGIWYGGGGSEPEEVAIKTVKNTTEFERIKLLQEAAIMGQFAHRNVIRLHGVVTVGEPVLIILEYMSRGDLRSFLQKVHPRNSKRELPDILPKLFVKFSKDIASGMGYLSKKNFIHRDLAARNILLTSDMTCKIGDFGMARDIEGESDYYKSHGGIIPVKWTAPEALNYNKYSSASDVWSYGMVLFEIWSLGEKPFNDLSNPIVIALVSSKHCQPPPPGCPRPIYHLMVECWNPNHNQRPNFDSIHDYLDSPGDSLLQWQPADMIEGKQAHVLGAQLMEANNLYLNLQRTYQKPLV